MVPIYGLCFALKNGPPSLTPLIFSINGMSIFVHLNLTLIFPIRLNNIIYCKLINYVSYMFFSLMFSNIIILIIFYRFYFNILTLVTLSLRFSALLVFLKLVFVYLYYNLCLINWPLDKIQNNTKIYYLKTIYVQ